MNERIEVIVFGRVQMVMYRDFAARKARGLGLVGEVKNLKDGTVRVVAEGSGEAIQKYVQKLQQGSLLSRVERVSLERKPSMGDYKSFSITYD